MAQTNMAAPIVARQALWLYRCLSAEENEREFFVALESEVAMEIARRLNSGQPVVVGREIQLQVGNYGIHARLTHLEPLLATAVDRTTQIIAQYREPVQGEGLDISAFISEVIRYPNPSVGDAFETLVGLEDIKEDMVRKLTLLLSPLYLGRWARHIYADKPPRMLLRTIHERYPLLILEGEVGSGKTALARSVGHRLASIDLRSQLALFVVNAQVRGGGHVGELSRNIARAFDEAEHCHEREQIPVLILLDEADALAQTRGGGQMHHEDSAGVNTLIQRIDRLRGLPIAVLFATNMAHALDPAILRRATAVYHFDRPTAAQRTQLFRTVLSEVALSAREVDILVTLTEPRSLPGSDKKHRYTYSDLVLRILPHAIESALYQQQALGIEHMRSACDAVPPTPEMHMA